MLLFREGCLYVKEPPGCSIIYARRGKYTMYMVTHRDKVHGECPYILAHCQVEDCLHPVKSGPSPGGTEVKLHFQNNHHEVEVCLLSQLSGVKIVLHYASGLAPLVRLVMFQPDHFFHT